MVKKLLPSEWMTVAMIALGVASFAFISYKSFHTDIPTKLDPSHFVIPQEIEVAIDGAVLAPGSYTLQKGATMEDLLALAEPTEQANLSRLRLHSKLRNGQKVRVPTKKNIQK